MTSRFSLVSAGIVAAAFGLFAPSCAGAASAPPSETPNWQHPFSMHLCGIKKIVDISTSKETGSALSCMTSLPNKAFIEIAKKAAESLLEKAQDAPPILGKTSLYGVNIQSKRTWLGLGCTLYAMEADRPALGTSFAQMALYPNKGEEGIDTFLDTVSTFAEYRNNPPVGGLEVLVCRLPPNSLEVTPRAVMR